MLYKNFLPTTLSKAYEQSKVGAGVEKEIAENFLITTIKGIGCNWMGCTAVSLCGQPQDMAGEMVGIWFPDLCLRRHRLQAHPREHTHDAPGPAGRSSASVREMLYKNFLPYHA